MVADGAGGTADGAAAAEAVQEALRALPPSLAKFDAVQLLQRLDQQLLHIGETTAVVAMVCDGKVMGASVGDSGAWLIGDHDCIDLTEQQRRKPLLGSGNALPVEFGPELLSSRLLLASDGLLKYVPRSHICELVRSLPVAEVGDALLTAARLPSGRLWDDVAVIVTTL
jgi:serine/threonine protein phosphatase PrpC